MSLVASVFDGLVSPRRSHLAYRSDVSEVKFYKGIEQIGDECSKFYPNVEKVTLPISLKIINDKAFNGCNKLKKLVIPESVIYIGRFVFVGCALEEINIPRRLEEYHSDMFACNNIKHIRMHKNNLTAMLESNVEAVLGGTNIDTIEVDGKKYDADKYFSEYCIPNETMESFFERSVRTFWGSPFATDLAKARVIYDNKSA